MTRVELGAEFAARAEKLAENLGWDFADLGIERNDQGVSLKTWLNGRRLEYRYWVNLAALEKTTEEESRREVVEAVVACAGYALEGKPPWKLEKYWKEA